MQYWVEYFNKIGESISEIKEADTLGEVAKLLEAEGCLVESVSLMEKIFPKRVPVRSMQEIVKDGSDEECLELGADFIEIMKISEDDALKILMKYSSEDMFRLLDLGDKMELGSLYSRILDLPIPQSMTRTELIAKIINYAELFAEVQEIFDELTVG